MRRCAAGPRTAHASPRAATTGSSTSSSPDGGFVAKIGPYVAAVKAVAWSSDGRQIAVGAYDSTVAIWDVASGELVTKWVGPQLWPRSLDWSGDGRTLIVGSMGTPPCPAFR